MIDQFEGLTKDKITLFVSFDCSRNCDLFSEKQIPNTFKRIKKAARKLQTCHTLICLHISSCTACKEFLKTNSMTYEVYDISTMQSYKETLNSPWFNKHIYPFKFSLSYAFVQMLTTLHIFFYMCISSFFAFCKGFNSPLKQFW